MQFSGVSSLVSMVVVGVSLCAGAALLGWALFKDRARGRKRCPKCWYDMSAAAPVESAPVVTYRCPECGALARGEAALLRTRRRWRVVWLCGVIALVAWWAPDAARRAGARGIIGLAPTTGLVVLVPLFEPRESEDSRSSPWADEVRVRCEKGELSSWQLRLLCEGAIRLVCREKVPLGGRVLVEARNAWWLLGAVSCVYSSSLIAGDEPVLVEQDVVDAGRMESGVQELTVRVLAETVGGECATAFSKTFAVRPVRDVGEIFEVVSGPEIDERVKSAMSCAIRRTPGRPDAGPGVSASLFMVDVSDPLVDELAIVAEIELRRDGRTVATLGPVPVDIWSGGISRGGSCWVELNEELVWDESKPESVAGWTVRVRGVKDESLARDVRRSRCWVGEFEVGLGEVLEKR